MKIAIYWKANLWGGSDTHLLTLLRNWPDQRDEFTIFYNQDNQGYNRIAPELKKLKHVQSVSFVQVVDIASANGATWTRLLKLTDYIGKPFLFWLMVRQSRRLFSAHGHFDGILAVNGGYPAAWESLAAIIAARQLGIPKRMLLVHHAATKPGIYTWEIFEHIVDRMICRSATDLVAVSMATRKSIIDNRRFNTVLNPVRVIYNGVDFRALQAKESIQEQYDLRKRFSLGDSLLVGIIGRIERIKGHEDLIAGFALLPKEYQKKIKLVFIGSGDSTETDRLRGIAAFLQIKDSLFFTGYLSGYSHAFVKQLDLVAAMSKEFEGFGLTIAEAMIVGVPVMATKVGAVPEFVSNETGFLVSPESPYEVCDVLNKFIEQRKIFQEKADLAKQHIRQFSAERMAKQFHMLFAMRSN